MTAPEPDVANVADIQPVAGVLRHHPAKTRSFMAISERKYGVENSRFTYSHLKLLRRLSLTEPRWTGSTYLEVPTKFGLLVRAHLLAERPTDAG